MHGHYTVKFTAVKHKVSSRYIPQDSFRTKLGRQTMNKLTFFFFSIIYSLCLCNVPVYASNSVPDESDTPRLSVHQHRAGIPPDEIKKREIRKRERSESIHLKKELETPEQRHERLTVAFEKSEARKAQLQSELITLERYVRIVNTTKKENCSTKRETLKKRSCY